MGQLDIVSQLISGLGLGALIVLGYTFILRHFHTTSWQASASAIVFALGAVAAMTNTIELEDGYLFDARAVFVVLSSSFGGPLAGVFVTVVVGTVRLCIGGDGALAGVMGVVIAGAAGVGFSLVRPKTLHLGSLFVLGCLCTLSLLSAAFLGTDHLAEILRTVGIPMIPIIVFGTVLLGSALESARQATSHLRDVEFNAHRDPLTGLYNRRALDQLELTVDREFSEARPESCAILFDIDRFKVVNDRYGHPRGDEVLKQVAKTISNRIRRSDFAVRYGGEELAVILLSTSSEDGARVAEQIRLTVEALKFSYEGQRFSITISAGVAAFTAGDTRLATALDFADRALYRAKNEGRNRTEVLNVAPKMAASTSRETVAEDPI